MNDIILDLCTQVRDCEAALEALGAAASARADEAARLVHKQAICERWLRVAGGEGTLARMRASVPPRRPPRLRA